MDDEIQVFVGSSSEQLEVARQAAAALRSSGIAARPWDEDTFSFSASIMESLEAELERADFAVVILTADDPANMRNKEVNLPRDNVILELGLFTGRLGRDRTFFVIDGACATKLASDLSGVTYVEFGRTDASGAAAGPGLAVQMERLAQQMRKKGVRYKPALDIRTHQASLWKLCSRLAGHWWSRIAQEKDTRSAISYVRITVDPVTNTPRLQGETFGPKGASIAKWESVVSGVVQGSPTKLYYRWQGENAAAHAQVFGGGGYIEFADDEYDAANGFFYDTNFTLVDEGAKTRVKHFRMYRCDADDQTIMSRRGAADAQEATEAIELVRRRLESLRGR